jgi:hypothetical protein
VNEPLKRRSLLGALDTTAPTLPPETIVETAVRNGFSASEPEKTPTPDGNSGGARRQRQPTGRIHQFNVRLRAETLDAIYAQANTRNVPVAQVIEEAIAALLR